MAQGSLSPTVHWGLPHGKGFCRDSSRETELFQVRGVMWLLTRDKVSLPHFSLAELSVGCHSVVGH